MEVQQYQPNHPYSFQNPTHRGFCHLYSLDSPREYSSDTVFSTLTVYHYCLMINIFFVLGGFVAVSACSHGVWKSSGYLSHRHAKKPTLNFIGRSRRSMFRRSRRKGRKRFALGHAVADVLSSSKEPLRFHYVFQCTL